MEEEKDSLGAPENYVAIYNFSQPSSNFHRQRRRRSSPFGKR